MLECKGMKGRNQKIERREWKRIMGKMGIFIHLKEDLEDPMKIPDFLPPGHN
jgi:hypothetical protein